MVNFLKIKQNEQQQKLKDLKKREKKRRIQTLTKISWLSSSVLLNQYILTNLSAFSASKLFLILDHTESYVEKIHSIAAELAGHAHKLDMIVQRLCGSSFSLFAVCMLAKL